MEHLFNKFQKERDKNPWDGHYSGIYRGKVLETNDPLRMHRLRVLIPDLYNANIKADSVLWASMANWFGGGPSAGSWVSPSIGDIVWVAFERGHPYSPVVIGFADPTRNNSYILDSIYGSPPITMGGSSPKYQNAAFLPKDERPYSMGFRSPYGQEIILNYTGFFPKAHQGKPASAGVDAVSAKEFEISQKSPEANSPDTKYMAFISGYGTAIIMHDAGHDWKKENVQSEGNLKSRYEYNLQFLNESAPQNRDQRRFEIRTRAGHKFEMRDVGFNKSRQGEYGNSVSLVGTASGGEAQDERWIKIKTKGGHLFQMMDVGFSQRDTFYSVLNKDDYGADKFARDETEDIGSDLENEGAKKDKRIVRMQTRHGHRILLDDRGSSSRSAESSSKRGIGIALQTNRGHYLGMCDRDEYNAIALHSARGQGLFISDRQQFVALSTELPTPISPKRVGTYGAEWPTISWDLNGEKSTYHLLLDYYNHRIAFKTPTRNGTDQGIEFSDAADAEPIQNIFSSPVNGFNSEDVLKLFGDEQKIALNKIYKKINSMQSEMAVELLSSVNGGNRCNSSWGEMRDKHDRGIYFNSDKGYTIYRGIIQNPLLDLAKSKKCEEDKQKVDKQNNNNPAVNSIALFMEEPLQLNTELPPSQEIIDEAIKLQKQQEPNFVITMDNSRKNTTDILDQEEASRFIVLDDTGKSIQIMNKDGSIFMVAKQGELRIEAKNIVFGADQDIIFAAKGKISMQGSYDSNLTSVTISDGIVGTNKDINCPAITGVLTNVPAPKEADKPDAKKMAAAEEHKPSSLYPKAEPCCSKKFLELLEKANKAIEEFNKKKAEVENLVKEDGDAFMNYEGDDLNYDKDANYKGLRADSKKAKEILNNIKKTTKWKSSSDDLWPGYGSDKYKTKAEAQSAAEKDWKQKNKKYKDNANAANKALREAANLRAKAEKAISDANRACANERCEKISQNTKDKKDALEKVKKDAIEALKKAGVKNAESLSASGISKLTQEQQAIAKDYQNKVDEARKNAKAAEQDEKDRCSKKKGSKLKKRGCAPNRSNSGKIPPMGGSGGVGGSVPVIVNNQDPPIDPPVLDPEDGDDNEIPDSPEIIDPPPFEPAPPDPADDLKTDEQGGSNGGVLWYGVSEVWLQEIIEKGLLVESLANIQNDPKNPNVISEFIELATSVEMAQSKDFLQISQNRYGGKGIILRIKNISEIGRPANEDELFEEESGDLIVAKTKEIDNNITVETFEYYASIPPKYIEIYEILPELPASSVPIVKK